MLEVTQEIENKGRFMRLKSTYSIHTNLEDGLDEVIIEFIPCGSYFNIAKIYLNYFEDSPCLPLRTKYYKLRNFTQEQQDKIKKIIFNEWSNYLEFMKLPLQLNVTELECFLREDNDCGN